MAGEKKPKSKSKHNNVQRWKKYKDGKLIGKTCPRCRFTFLAMHKDRVVCGKCGYAESAVKK